MTDRDPSPSDGPPQPWTGTPQRPPAEAPPPPPGAWNPPPPAAQWGPTDAYGRPIAQYDPAPDERTSAMWCHLGPLLISVLTCGVLAILGWIVPLVIMNGKGRTSPFVRHHAAQSLNFYIEMFIAGFVSAILMFVLIGFLLFPIVVLWELIFVIVATVQASSGRWYRIPANLPLIT